MAIKVSVINMKGGVGKSTLTVNLAWHLAAYRDLLKRVLVVDLDPQFNASQYLLGTAEYQRILTLKQPTIWDVFEQGTRTPRTGGAMSKVSAKKVIRPYRTIDGGGKIDLIPSRLELAFSLKNPGQKERHLSRLVREVEDQYDLILIDCAPTESVLTTAAYLASDWLLVPVKPEYLSTIGLPLLVQSMREFKAENEEHTLELAGVVFNATLNYFPEEALAKETVRRIAKQNKWYVFEHEVEYSKSYPKGAREGRPLFRTSYSRVAKRHNFWLFAREFVQRVGL
jgi:chromosome partitioning protein